MKFLSSHHQYLEASQWVCAVARFLSRSYSSWRASQVRGWSFSPLRGWIEHPLPFFGFGSGSLRPDHQVGDETEYLSILTTVNWYQVVVHLHYDWENKVSFNTSRLPHQKQTLGETSIAQCLSINHRRSHFQRKWGGQVVLTSSAPSLSSLSW